MITVDIWWSHNNPRRGYLRNCSRSTNYVLFFLASYYQTGCPLREDLGKALSGTQLKPGSAFKDPSLHDVVATRNERRARSRWCGARVWGGNGTTPGVVDSSFLDPLNFGWYHLLAIQRGEQQMTLRFHSPENRMRVLRLSLFFTKPVRIYVHLGKIQTNRI